MLPEDQDLSDLLAKKEQEWRDIQQRQILFLQQNLKEAQKNLREQKDKFERLKKDFTHNLKVLEERDRELEQHEAALSRLTVMENAKRSEISDLKVQMEKLQQELLKEKKSYSDLQGQYQRRIKEHQIDLDRVQSSKNSDIDHLLEEYEKVKRQLERKMEEVRGDLTLQKQELSLEFDCELKKREHEFRVRLDEMSTVVLSHELKVKLLTKELEVVRERELLNTESLQQTESANQTLQEALRHKDFEIKDLEAVKDARIKELQDEVQALNHQLRRREESFQIKHEQLDRCAREKASALRSMKEAHSAEVLQLEKQMQELQRCVETLQMEQQRAQCSHQVLLEEKDATIHKLKDDVDTLRSGWDSYISQVSKDTVSKDVHIQSLQEEEEKLKAQMARYQRDIERYQQQLAGSVERERLLDQARVQVELDWQKRCEEAEKLQYQKSEELVENLSKAKDQLEAELKEKDRRVKELQLIVTTVTWERDRAVSALTKQGASNHTGDQIPASRPDFASSEIQRLQEQNAELRQVIGQMRTEMETLCEQISPAITEQKAAPTEDKQAPSTDYVKSLEEEIRNLKQRIREMEEQLQAAPSPKDPPDLPPPAKPVLPDNVYIQTHIRSLNDTIGALRADKVASAAAAKRLETRTAHLDALVAELTQKVQQKQAEVSQLQFQLNSEARHSQAAIASLQQRRTELELQLAEARKEAEEYFKGNLKQNLETVRLGNEVCALKLELASQRVPVVLSESETIKHLREEALSLRQQLSALTASGGGVPANAYILRSKLKEAVKKISQLSVEKQQLIDMGNRLRAELASAEANTLQSSGQAAASTPPSRLPAAPEPENRLSALERLQYQLTSQELQFAQYQKTPQVSVKSQQQSDSGQSSLSGEQKPLQKENLSPSPRVHHVTSARSLHSTASLTEGDASLQDVWKILDMGSSPSLISSLEESQQVPGKTRQKEESPKKMASSVRYQPGPRKTPERSGRPAGHTRGRGSANTPKIRNYNIRD